ncbi:hypothetical protein GA0070622_1176 [Micromonospora sediminicola]|uniref:Integral membrane protein n=1 Tax=Micromonospora sediminicola TaxID=946078 RepID=A0A1A9B568_9ACTN|nr:hypothetical protein [Micromonospora sediminicola]SBT64206.1 hypothetical protein GA0070622_1176 [Micromonospora sediminicola]
MNDLNTVLAGIGAAACWYFVVAFWVTTGGDWRHNPGGRHVMQFTANLGLLMTLIVLARVWPQYPGRAAVTLVAFAALVAQVVWRCVLLHRAQHAPAERR